MEKVQDPPATAGGRRSAGRLPWAVLACTVTAIAVGAVLSITGTHGGSGGISGVLVTVGTLAFVAGCATVGALVWSRQPANAIGPLLSAAAVCYVVPTITIEAGTVAVRLSDWFGTWIWMLGIVLVIVFVLLLFPNGRLPSPRWRPVAWTAAIGTAVFVVGSAFQPGVIPDTSSVNPVGIGGSIGVAVFGAMHTVGLIALLLTVPVTLGSLGFRYHAADRTEREQMRWLLFAGALILVAIVLNPLVGKVIHDPAAATDLANALTSLAVAMVPIAIGIAVLKYRLYDIDLVIKKTLVFGLLVLFITVVYAAIVAVVSGLFEGSHAGSYLAAAALAMLFAPARDRARKIADRLVYGKRATPYEVLAEFSDRVGDAYATDNVLTRMAQVLEEGTGAVGARVLLRVGSEQREAAAIGSRSEDETVVPVAHQGEELGALAVSMPPSDPMNPAKLQLVEDLASQAGLVLRNVKLIEELKASRQRLVAAQDEERRKIERNIHDGAQQQLVALAVQLKLAEQMVGRDPDKERRLLATLAVQTNDALEDLRNLARGIYPPLLQDKGLLAALEAQARRAVVPTTVAADGIGRFSPEIESAVYFSCLEALQNIAKYANARSASIILSNGEGALRFTVADDGAGFDTEGTTYGTGLQGIADRLAAIGGELSVTSAPGKGSTVAGTVPA